jgi:hypothetical protein
MKQTKVKILKFPHFWALLDKNNSSARVFLRNSLKISQNEQ